VISSQQQFEEKDDDIPYTDMTVLLEK